VASLKERFDSLEQEFPPNRPRFQIHRELPVAILVYAPDEEWEVRRQVALFASRLEKHGRTVHTVSVAELLWAAIDEAEPDAREKLFRKERTEGFAAAQRQLAIWLTHERFAPFDQALEDALRPLDPAKHIALVTRVAALGPNILQLSSVLERLQGKVKVPTVVFYPGRATGTNGLVFMDQPHRDAHGAYRVKIYA
jgi:hypothetical protein